MTDILHAPTRTRLFELSQRVSTPIALIATALIVYSFASSILYSFEVRTNAPWSIYAIVSVLVLAGAKIRYAETTRSFSVLLRAVTAFAIFYIVTSHVSIPETIIGSKRLADYELNIGWLVAIGGGVIAMYRPTFAMIPLTYVVWQKQQLTHVFGLRMSHLDYYALIETGNFLVLGLLLWMLGRAFVTYCEGSNGFNASQSARRVQPTAGLGTLDFLALTAVALHFANYWYAGLIKASLGSHPLFWALENPTPVLLLAALESGALPISFSETLTSLSYEMMSWGRILSNFITLGIQLFAIFAIIRIRWAIIATICYDIMHVLIFVLTGIFFWKFILLNLAIVFALTPLRRVALSRSWTYLLISVVVISPFVFNILPSFAWLDSRSMNRVQIMAITEDGKEYRVPSNYFLSVSVVFAQQNFFWPDKGPFKTSIWGTTRNQAIMEAGNRCTLPVGNGQRGTHENYVSQGYLTEIIQRYHRFVLTKIDAHGRFEYDWYPHHIFSMPWDNSGFRELDKRRIVAYRYKIDALCLGYEDGKPHNERKWSASYDIPLAP